LCFDLKYYLINLTFALPAIYNQTYRSPGGFPFKMNEILNLRKPVDETSQYVYFDFIDNFVSVVVGKRKFQKVCHVEKLSKFMTISDEALTLLLVENSYDRWIDMAKTKNTKVSNIPPKYTNGGISSIDSQGSSRKYGGWSIEGLKRFDQLYAMVQADRISKHFDAFEEEFRCWQLKNKSEQNENKKRNSSTLLPGDQRNFSVRNDLWDDNEGLCGENEKENEGYTISKAFDTDNAYPEFEGCVDDEDNLDFDGLITRTDAV
jgi:hypothetical protein